MNLMAAWDLTGIMEKCFHNYNNVMFSFTLVTSICVLVMNKIIKLTKLIPEQWSRGLFRIFFSDFEHDS